MPPNQTPIPPVVQPDNNLNFVPNPNQPQPTPPTPAPPAPAVDPTISQLQSDVNDIKTAISALVPATPEPAPAPAAEPAKKYDEWGAVFEDTGKQAREIVQEELAAIQQEQTQSNEQLQTQEQQNQQYIDTTLTQLRNAGYLPQVTNQFDNNDPGKQAENELLGYTIYGLGSTDLVKAAQELKFRHDAGFSYDYNSKQFVQSNPASNNPNDNMFGSLPQNPNEPQGFQPNAPVYPNQPTGPQNPYAPNRYPAGFNAPVSSGNSYMGTQGGVPTLRNIRTNSYDALVDQFNRSQ